MKNHNYQPFNRFVLRTPLFPISYFQNLTDAETTKPASLKKLFQNPSIAEAIFLASPDLFFELQKWYKGQLNSKKNKRIEVALMKYISRMSSRCTPFGLFAGYVVGDFSEKTSIQLKPAHRNIRRTRLDMNYLVSLSQDLAKNPVIRGQLLFFPNTSIYLSGNQYRYIEYQYVKGQRTHQVIGVEQSKYIDKILFHTKNGATISKLTKVLKDKDVTEQEAYGFVLELIENQVLISQLEPSVSGPEFLDQIIDILKPIKNIEEINSTLNDVKSSLTQLDQKIGNKISQYLEIAELLKSFETEFNLKYLFQTDMEISTHKVELAKKHFPVLKMILSVLAQSTPREEEDNLIRFKEAFKKRYDNREIPLSLALDVETGIGYLKNQENSVINPLIDDLKFEEESNQINFTYKLNGFQRILFSKIQKALFAGDEEILIGPEDFQQQTVKLEDLPDTISMMFKIIVEKGVEKVKISSIGGSSGVNLLGRFCYGDEELLGFVKEIVEFETGARPNVILAEIVHLPEARVGNILMRPNLREFEIPYLARSNKAAKNIIGIDDLVLSVRNNKFILRSKSLNREIIPRLSNAHNFGKNALPLYQFLCDLQTQDLRSGLFFGLGALENEFCFIPRISFNEIILFPATWIIQKKEIKKFLHLMDTSDEFLIESVKSFCLKKKIPKYILLIDGDNELLINTQNLNSVEVLLSTVRNRPSFRITEFLFDSNSALVRSGEEFYSNEFIVAFKNKNKG